MPRWSDAVATLLDEDGMTQTELARLAGVHPDTIGHIVHGGHCSTETLEKIAAALGVDLAELFGPPLDEQAAALRRDRLVGAVLRELSSLVSEAVTETLVARRGRRAAPRRRAVDVELPFTE